jgi:chromosome segregation ATPase
MTHDERTKDLMDFAALHELHHLQRRVEALDREKAELSTLLANARCELDTLEQMILTGMKRRQLKEQIETHRRRRP